jgi:hypothetical protein
MLSLRVIIAPCWLKDHSWGCLYMFQHRLYLFRGVLAGLLALIGLLAMGAVPSGLAVQLTSTSTPDQLPVITPTISIDLAPDNGPFVEVQSTNLPGVQDGSAHWGDCNNDTASDILLTGQVSSTLRIARVYQQQAGGSFAFAATFADLIHGAAAWGDYDNDGWLDVALTGESAGVPISRLYRNMRNGTTCTFSMTAASLIGVRHSAVAWGDYNGDGQLDLLLAGNNGSQPVTRLYRNNRGSFIDSGLSLPGIQDGAAIWGDYNNDGWVDLLLTGSTVGGAPLTKLYRNTGSGGLIDTQASLPALSNSAAAWGDYDNDGDLDLLLEGTTAAGAYIAEIYRNNQGVLVKNTGADTLMGNFTWTTAAWGDYDTDGYLDAVVSTGGAATVYRNEITGSFAAGIAVGSSLLSGTVAWGNYDNDLNLDILVAGRDLLGAVVTRIYRYSNITASKPPSMPMNLTAAIAGPNVTLRWSSPITDDHTPLAGLSYNLRVGTQPGGIDVIAPMAMPGTGNRLLPAVGNVYQARAITLTSLSVGQRYYWSVQAIDTSYLGSRFAVEGNFLIPHRAFLPAVLKDHFSYYTSEWETEPNNTYQQANGALKSGQIYRGVHNDEKDYYSVYLQAAGTLGVSMSSPNSGTQLQLFYQIADVDHRVGFDLTSPYQITYTGAPGWYYIYVHTNPALVGSQTYTLTATYP